MHQQRADFEADRRNAPARPSPRFPDRFATQRSLDARLVHAHPETSEISANVQGWKERSRLSPAFCTFAAKPDRYSSARFSAEPVPVNFSGVPVISRTLAYHLLIPKENGGAHRERARLGLVLHVLLLRPTAFELVLQRVHQLLAHPQQSAKAERDRKTI